MPTAEYTPGTTEWIARREAARVAREAAAAAGGGGGLTPDFEETWANLTGWTIAAGGTDLDVADGALVPGHAQETILTADGEEWLDGLFVLEFTTGETAGLTDAGIALRYVDEDNFLLVNAAAAANATMSCNAYRKVDGTYNAQSTGNNFATTVPGERRWLAVWLNGRALQAAIYRGHPLLTPPDVTMVDTTLGAEDFPDAGGLGLRVVPGADLTVRYRTLRAYAVPA